MSNNEIMPRTGRISQKCGENSPSFCAGGQGSGLRGGWGFRKSEIDKWLGEQEQNSEDRQ